MCFNSFLLPPNQNNLKLSTDQLKPYKILLSLSSHVSAKKLNYIHIKYILWLDHMCQMSGSRNLIVSLFWAMCLPYPFWNEEYA